MDKELTKADFCAKRITKRKISLGPPKPRDEIAASAFGFLATMRDEHQADSLSFDPLRTSSFVKGGFTNPTPDASLRSSMTTLLADR